MGVHLGVLTWVLRRSWWHAPDYALLADARASTGTRAVLDPLDGRLSVVARAAAELVAREDPVRWPLAAGLLVAAQLLASLAVLALLLTACGRRPRVLPLLTLYLASPLTWAAGRWWASGLTTAVLVALVAGALAARLRAVRSGRRRWDVAAATAAVLAALCSPAALALPVLLGGLHLLRHPGGGADGQGGGLRRTGVAVGCGAVVAVAAAVVHAVLVPGSALGEPSAAAARAALATVGEAWLPGLLGGPWTWSDDATAARVPDPPAAAVAVAAVVVTAVVVALLRRPGARAPVALLLGWVVVVVVLGTFLAAPTEAARIEVPTQLVAVLVPPTLLAVGLALGPRPVDQSAAPREGRLRRLTAHLEDLRPLVPYGAPVAAALLVVVALLATTTLVRAQLTDDAAADWARAARQAAEQRPVVDLADAPVPAFVDVPSRDVPLRTGTVLDLVTDNVRVPVTTSNLVVVTEDGALRPARVVGTAAYPALAGTCGSLVADAPVRVRLPEATGPGSHWVSIGYLSGANRTLAVRAGDTEAEVPMRSGAKTVYVRVEGDVRTVVLDPVTREGGPATCVVGLDVGDAE
ncbi:hypothetical protein ACOACO_10370 [Nocardioides sp. CPCC 205120]|uniref:hypothetical protein n=1 Tax=Nocardioides sp. CPCC 205120 TaxID=3406462 RepID=UPI003B5044D8